MQAKRPVSQLIREKREWHTPKDEDAAKLGFKGWYSCGYPPHFDMPGLWQMINYRLADSMPAGLRHEWEALFQIKDDVRAARVCSLSCEGRKHRSRRRWEHRRLSYLHRLRGGRLEGRATTSREVADHGPAGSERH